MKKYVKDTNTLPNKMCPLLNEYKAKFLEHLKNKGIKLPENSKFMKLFSPD